MKFSFNGVEVYALYTWNNAKMSYDISYYYTKDAGNYYTKGESLYIDMLHTNIRIVAKFVENYQILVNNVSCIYFILLIF